MAINPHSIENLVPLGVAFALGAKDSHVIPGFEERAGFLPDAAVKRHRLVLNDD